jgi:hypothetical protein
MQALILAIALSSCPNNYTPDASIVSELLQIETAEQVPAGLLVAAACFYAQRVRKALDRAERDCPGRGRYESREAYLWASAATTATRAPVRRGGRFVSRCARRWTRGESKHWALRRSWINKAPAVVAEASR